MTSTDRRPWVCLLAACALAVAGQSAAIAAYGHLSGGMIAKREDGGGLAIKGFQPKLAASNCLTVAGRDGRDRLICRTFWAAQGQRMTSVSEVIVTRRDGAPAYEFKPIVEARDAVEARGANIVDCGSDGPALFEIRKIGRGAAPGVVTVDAVLAGRAVTRTACADKGRAAGFAAGPLEDNEAPVFPREAELARLQLDIHHGAIAVMDGRPAR